MKGQRDSHSRIYIGVAKKTQRLNEYRLSLWKYSPYLPKRRLRFLKSMFVSLIVSLYNSNSQKLSFYPVILWLTWGIQNTSCSFVFDVSRGRLGREPWGLGNMHQDVSCIFNDCGKDSTHGQSLMLIDSNRLQQLSEMQSQSFAFCREGCSSGGSDSNASHANAICLDPGELLPDGGIPSNHPTEHEQRFSERLEIGKCRCSSQGQCQVLRSQAHAFRFQIKSLQDASNQIRLSALSGV